MFVIGISGPIGHGKSTLAQVLVERLKPSTRVSSSDIITVVANAWLAYMPPELPQNPRKQALLDMWIDELAEIVTGELRPASFKHLRVTPAGQQKHPELYAKLFEYLELIKRGDIPARERIAPEYKEDHRAILQWLGGYLVAKVDPEIWFGAIEKRIQEANEEGYKLFVADGVRYLHDAEVIKRNKGLIVKLVQPTNVAERDAEDVTERERKQIDADITIYGDRDAVHLKLAAEAMMDDLLTKRVSKEYRAEDFAGLA